MPTIAIIAPGSMGSGIGQRLAEHGAAVVTCLVGRSQASAERARRAGMRPVEDENLAAADFLLSIVPPGAALGLAERLAPVLGRAPRKPVYVDCNAVNPRTVERIAAVVDGAGCKFVDAGIIGGPPVSGGKGPGIYASGPDAHRLADLTVHGLDIRVMDGPVGAASALKMSYAGITKGFTALGAVMMLAATRAGTAEALRRELADSQPNLLAWLTRAVPAMHAKAYRWVAEMEEVAGFVGEGREDATIFAGAARFYERIAADADGPEAERVALTAFCNRPEASA